MSDFQLTHIALVGARMEAFHNFGYEVRNELAMRLVVPSNAEANFDSLPEHELASRLRTELPIWIHNIITDSNFPQRQKILMALRKFEGELRDNKNNEVISNVLSKGFRNQPFDPLKLPPNMPPRQRRSIASNIEIWRAAYESLEQSIVDALTFDPLALKNWCRQTSAKSSSAA